MTLNPAQPDPPHGSSSPGTETRTAILDAAEQLFAENGVASISVRDIARLANANLGAINYYFGTKDRLAVEVFIRALEPSNQRRLAWLDRLEAEAGEKPIKLETLMEVLIRPMLEHGGEEVRESDAFRRLMSHCFYESNPEIKAFVKERFATVCQRFDTAISRALPHLPPEELFWRTHFVIGAMHHAIGAWLQFDFIPLPTLANGQQPRKLDAEELVQELVACSTAAFRSPIAKIFTQKEEAESPSRPK